MGLISGFIVVGFYWDVRSLTFTYSLTPIVTAVGVDRTSSLASKCVNVNVNQGFLHDRNSSSHFEVHHSN